MLLMSPVGLLRSVCDSHNELPQSKHSVLAALEQGNPSSSAEFLTSIISQRFIVFRKDFFQPQSRTEWPMQSGAWRMRRNAAARSLPVLPARADLICCSRSGLRSQAYCEEKNNGIGGNQESDRC